MLKKLLLCTCLITNLGQSSVINEYFENCINIDKDQNKKLLNNYTGITEENNNFTVKISHRRPNILYDENLKLYIDIKKIDPSFFPLIELNKYSILDKFKSEWSIFYSKEISCLSPKNFLTSDAFKEIKEKYEEKIPLNRFFVSGIFCFFNNSERNISFDMPIEEFATVLPQLYNHKILSENLFDFITKKLKLKDVTPSSVSPLVSPFNKLLVDQYFSLILDKISNPKAYEEALKTYLKEVPSSLQRQQLVAYGVQKIWKDRGISPLVTDLCAEIEDQETIISEKVIFPVAFTKFLQDKSSENFLDNLNVVLKNLVSDKEKLKYLKDTIVELSKIHPSKFNITKSEYSHLILDLSNKLKDMVQFKLSKESISEILDDKFYEICALTAANAFNTTKSENKNSYKEMAFDNMMRIVQDIKRQRVIKKINKSLFFGNSVTLEEVPAGVSNMTDIISENRKNNLLSETQMNNLKETTFYIFDQQQKIRDLQAQVAQLQAQFNNNS